MKQKIHLTSREELAIASENCRCLCGRRHSDIIAAMPPDRFSHLMEMNKEEFSICEKCLEKYNKILEKTKR